MNRSSFSEERIIGILKENEGARGAKRDADGAARPAWIGRRLWPREVEDAVP